MRSPFIVFCECKYIENFHFAKTKIIFFLVSQIYWDNGSIVIVLNHAKAEAEERGEIRFELQN